MPVRTRARHTSRTRILKVKRPRTTKRPKDRSIPWREVFKEELKEFGQAALMLRGSRHKMELTQKELADALGISQNHVSEMEHGKRPIGKVMALRMGKFFKTDYRKFM